MSELEELKLAYAECSRQRNELLNKLKSQAQRQARSADTWVGLTDDEVIDIAGSFDYRYDVARAAEAKLKAKNFA